ncbi:MAG: hypothetical protein AAFX65_01080 [Cyanobacteria bacterium J06638_7]
MPFPELPPAAELGRLVAAAADHCRQPLRHAVLPLDGSSGNGAAQDSCLRLEVRDASGSRQPHHDLELELYRSGEELHLTLAWASDANRPLLWQGSHPLWMDASSGQRCQRPGDGEPLESLARRLRALLG